jgi:hypothetical protein
MVLVAVSSAYVALIAQQLSQLAAVLRVRLRLFGAVDSKYPSDLRPQLMPYDARLDSLVRGSKVDFAQRAAEHFVAGCLTNSFPTDLEQQRNWVQTEMARVATRASAPKRRALNDAEIRAIAADLAARGIGQSKALSILRQERQVACEQSRFRRLFLEATK